MQLLLQWLENGAARGHSSQPDKRADVSDMSVAIQCLVADSQSYNEVGSFNKRLFFCSAGRLCPEVIRRDEFFLTYLCLYRAFYSIISWREAQTPPTY